MRLSLYPVILCGTFWGIKLFFLSSLFGQSLPPIEEFTQGFSSYEGYIDFYVDPAKDRIYWEIDQFDQDLLYANGLAAGLGSNDIGLDRKQLGGERVIQFRRAGQKVLILQPNLDYRAISDNPEEAKSVAEAFASSVLWGLPVVAATDQTVLVDATGFLMQDAHDVIGRLQSNNQGTYRIDESRSALYLPNTKAFPENVEFESLITYVGKPKGREVRSVTPTPSAITLRLHHSLIKLPTGYTPRKLDLRSGFNGISYQDYAQPIDQPMKQQFTIRHRLEKKNPNAAMSEPVEPIIYYLDRGTPEPIASALLEGASWWSQAFEAAGYKNAFIVKMLPADADPMDVRYNLINWVHRSTRGWSYGSSIVDPRTGEILKGHVLLGSLRVRQDYLIAQGLIESYAEGKTPDPRMEEMALARLRQLSAHEVGHTLGLAHNFAASTQDRASVMDYPHPYLTLAAQGNLAFDQAYDTGIGEWDKRAIIFGYQDFPAGTDEAEALEQIMQETIDMGLVYISDDGARAFGTAHPKANLWDNGPTPKAEFDRILRLRRTALANFSEKNIPVGTPHAELERVLVPIYLAHRYQATALAKLIGGVDYTYSHRGDGQTVQQSVPVGDQQEALTGLLETLEPSFLAIPTNVRDLIPPAPIAYQKGREYFASHTGRGLDMFAAATSSVDHTIGLILHRERLARVYEQSLGASEGLSLGEIFSQLWAATASSAAADKVEVALAELARRRLVAHLLATAADANASEAVKAAAHAEITRLEPLVKGGSTANDIYLAEQIRLFRANPASYEAADGARIPDGSPIGCGGADLMRIVGK